MIPPQILIVDDDANILRVLSLNLIGHGFNVATCQNGEEALAYLAQDSEVNTIVTDLSMDKMTGDVLFYEVNGAYPDIPVIILTNFGTIESAVKLVKDGAFDYIQKPFDKDKLIKIINNAIKQNLLKRQIHGIKQELNKKNKAFQNIIGNSKKMLGVFELIKAVSKSDSNVLITGESGTGKELVARAIHACSKRATQLFVPINCAAIPHTLMESEFFGHEAGAFTGAINRRVGKFQLADKGSIFLDEIGDLDKNLQTKLLRVLEEKQFQPIGSNNDIKTDFRLIAATNRDLVMAVDKNEFREDLYYRLNVVEINIPPLRARKDDIALLSDLFLKKYSVIENKSIREISPEAYNFLCAYNWPGNVRELENVIKRAIILCKTNEIKKGDLPPTLVKSTDSILENKLEKELGKDNEKKRIVKALKIAGGNKTKAAKIIGIDRRELYRKLVQYDLDKDLFKNFMHNPQ